jgi:hypothetical protein
MRTNFQVECEKTPLEENSFGGKLFDIIYHCNVLSHFYDPISEFKRINTKLKDGGIQVFETGNTGDVKKELYKYFPRFGYPDHLFFFSEDSIGKLLKATGFELIKIYRYSKIGYLFMLKYLKQIKMMLKSLRAIDNKSGDGKEKLQLEYGNRPSHRKLIKNTKEHLIYLLTYKVGYFTPKKGHPQALIVIAKKN